MSLIAETKKLRELEQQAIGGTWSWEAWHDGPLLYSTEYKNGDKYFNPQPGAEMDLLVTLRNLAPAMLEVLGCFQEGDVERLRKGDYSVVQRMIYAAGLMEQER